ncbi:MAG: metallophosphoesterase family protein [Candidatus Brocadiales bacterium]
MRILIISDVHSNIQALSAVWEKEKEVDKVFCLGDLVNYGPNPRECIEFVRSISNKILKGNHDNAVGGGPGDCGCPPQYRIVSEPAKRYTQGVLNEGDKEFLRTLPLVEEIELDGSKFLLSHGSPKGDNCKFLPPGTPDEVMAKELEGVEADFVFIGHTHLSMLRRVNGVVVVNPGSLGFPSGDNPMSSYAIWEDGEVEIKRVKYDVGGAVNALKATGMSPETIDALSRKLTSGRF